MAIVAAIDERASAGAAGDTFVASNVLELVRLRLHVRRQHVALQQHLQRVAARRGRRVP
ncbi:MAG TPA: hypothetical protein VNH11_06495 [Pirellulales bacterium]|nr:hypothetical protein [Pirellulales bacterium]